MSTPTTTETPPRDVPPTRDVAPKGAARLAALFGASRQDGPLVDGPSRVYRGRTVEELIPKIQAELGQDAIIVRRHKGLTGGIAGFFQRPFVEIEARQGAPGIDRYDEDEALPALPGRLEEEPESEPASAEVRAGMNAQASADVPESEAEQFRELTPASLLGRSPVESPPSMEPPPALNGSHGPPTVWDADPFAAALAEAEAAILPAEAMTFPVEAATLPAEPAILQATPAAARSAAAPSPNGRTRAAVERALLEVGMGQELVDELIETAVAHVRPLMPSRPSLARAVHGALVQQIPVCAPLPVGRATIALVGPGGSGKTACCVALLRAYSKSSTLPAACATLVEGGTRGELAMRVIPYIYHPLPLEDPRVDAALRGAREGGLLLLDTPPVSPAQAGSIRALATLLERQRPDRVVLALPATLGAKPAAQLLEALRPLGASALAITHADETDQLGVAVEAACRFGLAPVHLLERGQRGHAGGDLTQIDPVHLADRLLPQR
ncbi:MAG TPA: hypothetical protein VNY52_07920 [Solirubrobacteraceae bacterium]|jgi:flagellar biosynthesis GTPase FlhF|nr:hypothetical protein [Solirubrobacteraceae bacterium]